MFSADFKILGAKVCYYRKLRGYSQLELATQINCSEDHISRIERAVAQGVSLKLIMAIAKELDVEVADLLKK